MHTHTHTLCHVQQRTFHTTSCPAIAIIQRKETRNILGTRQAVSPGASTRAQHMLVSTYMTARLIQGACTHMYHTYTQTSRGAVSSACSSYARCCSSTSTLQLALDTKASASDGRQQLPCRHRPANPCVYTGDLLTVAWCAQVQGHRSRLWPHTLPDTMHSGNAGTLPDIMHSGNAGTP